MKPDEKHIKNVCKVGRGAETCSFLTLGSSGFACAKGTTEHHFINIKLARGQMTAIGDNCSGPPDFKLPEYFSKPH